MATSYAESIRERLTSLVEPLREEERKLDERISELELELAELKPIRTDIRRQLRAITGEPYTNQNGKPHANAGKKLGKRRTHKAIGTAGIEAVRDWLVAHESEYPEGFVGSDIARAEDAPLSSQTRTAAALRVLHDQGLVRVDHIGGSGQKKFYKLTEAAR